MDQGGGGRVSLPPRLGLLKGGEVIASPPPSIQPLLPSGGGGWGDEAPTPSPPPATGPPLPPPARENNSRIVDRDRGRIMGEPCFRYFLRKVRVSFGSMNNLKVHFFPPEMCSDNLFTAGRRMHRACFRVLASQAEALPSPPPPSPPPIPPPIPPHRGFWEQKKIPTFSNDENGGRGGVLHPSSLPSFPESPASGAAPRPAFFAGALCAVLAHFGKLFSRFSESEITFSFLETN